ncbi:MAG: hypothetical protein J5836_03370 [Clostridia bacterium]|nr:hypothetical protein [Clostridia bacterium]
MKVLVINGGEINESKADLIIYTEENKTIRYKTELSGKSEELKSLAKLSSVSGAVVISPFDTDNYGVIKRSAGVFDKGKLLGISDMAISYEDSPYMPGVAGGIYETDFGKIGVVIGDDFYSYEVLRSYAVCGVKLAVILKKERTADMDKIVLRAYSYLIGMPSVYVSKNCIFSVDFKGNIAFSGTKYAEIEVSTLNEYYLKISKTRFCKR